MIQETQEQTYEVLWAGRGAMPHELTNRHLWRTKANLMDYAPASRPGDLPRPEDLGKRIPKARSWRRKRRSCQCINGRCAACRLRRRVAA